MIRIAFPYIFYHLAILLAVLPMLLLATLYFLGQALHRCGVALQDGAEAAARGMNRRLDRLAP